METDRGLTMLDLPSLDPDDPASIVYDGTPVALAKSSNKGSKLKPGMFASVRLPVHSSVAGSLYVPKSAVISTIDQTFVLKVVDGKAIRITVQKEDDTAGQRQVFSDLNPVDIILKTISEDLVDRVAVKTQLVSQ